MNIPTSIYKPKSSPVHTCHAGVKIVLLLAFSVGAFFVSTWWGLLGYAVLCGVAVAVSKVEVRWFVAPLIPVAVMMAFPVLFNGWSPGLFYAARILLLALASFLVCFTTTPTALIEAFSAALSPLRVLKVPVDDIATTLSLALRFIPELAVQVQRIHDAQVTRGAMMDEGPVFARIKAWGSVFIPLFVGMFRKADRLAQAMDARCYGMPGVRRTELVAAKPGVGSWCALVLGVLSLVLIAVFL